MFLRRSAVTLARQVRGRPSIPARTFTTSVIRRELQQHAPRETPRLGKLTIGPFLGDAHAAPSGPPSDTSKLKSLEEIKQNDDILPPGAPTGTIPTDLNQSTGLERLEILGKMEGIDIFDMRPMDASRKGLCLTAAALASFAIDRVVWQER
jgi:cytochrome c oxidase subunit 5b